MKAGDSQTTLFYDKDTGAVVGSYSHFDIAKGEYVEATEDRLRELAPAILGDRAPETTGVTHAVLPAARSVHGMTVDVKTGQLRPRDVLRVAAAKDALHGDGKDSTELEISAVDGEGKPVAFDGELQVQTSRGKLSERGGRIAMKGGRGTISLTAVAETVHRVTVTAIDPSGRCAPGIARLSFE